MPKAVKKMKKKKAPEKPTTLDQLLIDGREINVEVKQIKEELKTAESNFRNIKAKILEELKTLGVDSSKKNDVAVVTVTRKTVASVQDWDALYEFIIQENMPQLLQKRVLNAGYLELRDTGLEIPGVTDVELEDLNFRILN